MCRKSLAQKAAKPQCPGQTWNLSQTLHGLNFGKCIYPKNIVIYVTFHVNNNANLYQIINFFNFFFYLFTPFWLRFFCVIFGPLLCFSLYQSLGQFSLVSAMYFCLSAGCAIQLPGLNRNTVLAKHSLESKQGKANI